MEMHIYSIFPEAEVHPWFLAQRDPDPLDVLMSCLLTASLWPGPGLCPSSGNLSGLCALVPWSADGSTVPALKSISVGPHLPVPLVSQSIVLVLVTCRSVTTVTVWPASPLLCCGQKMGSSVLLVPQLCVRLGRGWMELSLVLGN